MREDEILLSLEQQRQQALITADIPLLAALLDEALIHIHSTGMVHNKTQFLRHIERMGGFVAITRPTPQIQLSGDIAILTGETCNVVRLLESGETAQRVGFSTLIWRRTAQGWRLLLSQLTPIEQRTTS